MTFVNQTVKKSKLSYFGYLHHGITIAENKQKKNLKHKHGNYWIKFKKWP